MSAPAVPDLASATLSMLRLSWTRLGILATVLVVIAAIAARYATDGSHAEDVVEAGVRVGFFGLLVYLLPFLFCSGAIAEEVEARTFAYLAIRPAGRVSIALGKYIAGAGMSAILLASGILVLHIAAYVTEPTPMLDELPGTFRSIGAITLLALCYSAICLFWGSVLVEASGILSTLHLAAIEFGFSWLPSFLRFGSMNYLASQLAGLPKGGFFPEWVPDMEPWIGGVVVAAVTLVFLTLASTVIKVSELGFGKS